VISEKDITVNLILDGFLEDFLLSVQSILNHSQVDIFVIVNGKQDFQKLEELSPRISINFQKQRLGWSNAINLALEKVTTDYIVLMDPSTRFTANPFPEVIASLELGYTGVGWRGGLVNLDDEWRSIDDKGVGEVDVLFGYFMVLDRKFTARVGANPSAKYYRNADLELSLAVREAGGKLLQIDLPLIQERHHGYHDVESAYREKHSKENYQRLLKRFRGNLGNLAPRR
jgi:glycosyltransferase involved in cell wall biosynthesis